MIIENKKNPKIITSILIILVFLSGVVLLPNPKRAQAQLVVSAPVLEAVSGVIAANTGVNAGADTTNTALHIKDVAVAVLKEVAKGVARKALAEMTKSTVNWINSGFHGQPLFLTNPESFFKDIGKSEIQDFIQATGYDSLKFPFGRDYALNVIASYKRQGDENLRYTLSNVIQDETYLQKYRNNFNLGGWNGFIQNTQYPQNNPVGYSLEASEKLGKNLEGTVTNTAKTVQKTLDQGMGFLSPQTCTDKAHSGYNSISNAFVKPTFNFKPSKELVASEPSQSDFPGDDNDPTGSQAYDAAHAEWEHRYSEEEQKAKLTWSVSNYCPPGALKSTTPGSVIASSITKALGASQDQASLGAAFGNSLSAIFDALINHYMDKGLAYLSSKVNPQPKNTAEDSDFCYMGQCLGSSSGSGSEAWDSGPDEVIVLSQFKKQVDDGIVNTQAELNLINNDTPGRPGLLQMISLTWPKIRELDMCQPGPDLGWEGRTDDEMERNSQKLQGKVNDSNGDIAAAAKLTYNALKFSVDFYKDWVQNQMLLALPHSVDYLDEIKNIDELYQKANVANDKNRLKVSALARLKGIKAGLAQIAVQPAPDTAQEKVLINLKKQFDSVETSISNSSSVEDSRNDLNVAKEKYNSLKSLIAQCNTERTAKGWGASVTPTGTPVPTSTPPESGTGNSTSNPPPIAPDLSNVTFSSDIEQDVASWPANINLSVTLGSDTVNYNYDKMDLFTPVGEDGSVGNGWIFVYKDGWQATTVNQFRPNHGNDNKAIDEIMCGGIGGTNTFSGTFHPQVGETYGFMVSGQARAGASPATDAEKVRSNVVMVTWTVPLAPVSCDSGDDTPAPSGPEQQYFCDAALVGGYHHDSFIVPNVSGSLLSAVTAAGSVKYPDIPLVNAKDVFHYTSFFGFVGHTVNTELKCSIIYKSTVLDYKKNLPGLTTVNEPQRGIDEDADNSCVAPADEDKHADPGMGAAIASARAELAAAGMKWIPPEEGDPNFDAKNKIYECNRFEMLKRAVKIVEANGSDAGIYSKNGGTNCEGYSVDIVAFPDGYLYDALTGGNNPSASWGAASCMPVSPEKYQRASNVPNTNYPPN